MQWTVVLDVLLEFNAYDTLSRSSSESLMWFFPNPLTPTRDIMSSVQVKVEEKQNVVVNSDNINPSNSLEFNIAANVQAIRKRHYSLFQLERLLLPLILVA